MAPTVMVPFFALRASVYADSFAETRPTSLFRLQAPPPASTRQVAFSFDPTGRAATGQVAGQAGFKGSGFNGSMVQGSKVVKEAVAIHAAFIFWHIRPLLYLSIVLLNR